MGNNEGVALGFILTALRAETERRRGVGKRPSAVGNRGTFEREFWASYPLRRR